MNHCERPKKRNCIHASSEIRSIGILLVIFGAVSVAAFFLPIRYWVLLLAILLIYCGYLLIRGFKR